MTLQQMQQAVRQCQDICNQLIAQEQRNADQLNQFGQTSLQNISRAESNAVQQLKQIQQLCNQLEQNLNWIASQPQAAGAFMAPPAVPYGVPYTPSYVGMTAPGIPPTTLQQVMRADHTQARPGAFQPSGTSVQPAYAYGWHTVPPVNQTALQQVLQADHNRSEAGNTPSQPAGAYQPAQAAGFTQAAYRPPVNPAALNQVMQADHNAPRA